MSTYEANRYSFPASSITAGTFDNARLSSGSVTQHVDLSNLNASNLTSGTVPNARFGTPTFSAANLTNIPAAGSTVGTWTPQWRYGSTNVSTTLQFSGYAKNGRWVGCHGMTFMGGSGGSQYDYTYVVINNLPYTSANISKHASFAGHGQGYGGTYDAYVFPNSTQLIFASSPGLNGRNANPPVFTNSGTEGAYYTRHQLYYSENANFGAKNFHFQIFYLANS